MTSVSVFRLSKRCLLYVHKCGIGLHCDGVSTQAWVQYMQQSVRGRLAVQPRLF